MVVVVVAGYLEIAAAEIAEPRFAAAGIAEPRFAVGAQAAPLEMKIKRKRER